TRVSDAFLMCSLHKQKVSPPFHWIGRVGALALLLLTSPLILISIAGSYLRGQRPVCARKAVRPLTNSGASLVYYEFPSSNECWRRWPQLWNIVRGEFGWVGNRPLSPLEAGKLLNDFERLWLEA